VERLLLEKKVQFEGNPRAVEGPAAFFLHGTLARENSTSAKSAKPQVISGRAAAIVRGLVRTGRAAKDIGSDQGMVRLQCLTGGFYWIWLDGSGVLRGSTFPKAEELQAKLRDAMERAGR
jgi:hypothetical protein